MSTKLDFEPTEEGLVSDGKALRITIKRGDALHSFRGTIHVKGSEIVEFEHPSVTTVAEALAITALENAIAAKLETIERERSYSKPERLQKYQQQLMDWRSELARLKA
jgi:hypothetical protein